MDIRRLMAIAAIPAGLVFRALGLTSRQGAPRQMVLQPETARASPNNN